MSNATETIRFRISALTFDGETEAATKFTYQLLDTEPFEVADDAAWDYAYNWAVEEGLDRDSIEVSFS